MDRIQNASNLSHLVFSKAVRKNVEQAYTSARLVQQGEDMENGIVTLKEDLSNLIAQMKEERLLSALRNILTESFESIDPRSKGARGCDGGARQELAAAIGPLCRCEDAACAQLSRVLRTVSMGRILSRTEIRTRRIMIPITAPMS
jgi:hypothetical protein